MTQEEKFEEDKKLYKSAKNDQRYVLESLFPELKQDKDKEIRKALLNYLTKMWGNCQDDICGIHVEDAIAWLEKQGEQKTTWSEEDTANHHNIMYFLNTNRITDNERECAIQWLKSLKQRLGGEK